MIFDVSYSFWGYLAVLLLALPFLLAGVNHVKNHGGLVGYAQSVGFPVPYLAGWPTGLLLLAGGIGLFFTNVVAVWAAGALIAFLALATAYFHRDAKNDVNFGKNIALIGALTYLIVTVAH